MQAPPARAVRSCFSQSAALLTASHSPVCNVSAGRLSIPAPPTCGFRRRLCRCTDE